MCLIPTGITRGCEYSFGGLSKVYLGNRDFITAKMDGDEVITGFTKTLGEKFYEFQVEPETAQLLEELQAGNASKFIQQTLNFSLTNITQEKKAVLEALGLAKIIALVEFQNGVFKVAGQYGSGLKATTLSIDSGTAIADLNGATVSLVGGSTGFANEATAGAVTSALS